MGMQNILDTPSVNQRQQSGSVAPSQCALRHTVSMVQTSAGNLSDTQAAVPSSAIRTMPAPVPAQPGITGDTASGVASAPTPTSATGGSLRSAKPSRPPAESGGYQRQRDNDHPAATWCTDRGEFVQATGPPPSACHLSP